jgi:hypothetical protein
MQYIVTVFERQVPIISNEKLFNVAVFSLKDILVYVINISIVQNSSL